MKRFPEKRSVPLLPALLLAFACMTQPVPETTGFVSADDGVRLAYHSIGSGPRVVLVPLDTWNAPWFRERARGFRLVFYDPRGRGASDPAMAGGWTIDRDLLDLETVRRFTGAERVGLIGTSYYAGLVALYAERFPEHVDRLVMVGSIAPLRAEQFEWAPPEAAERVTQRDRDRLTALKQSGGDPVRYCIEHATTYRRLVAGRVANVTDAEIAERCKLPNEHPDNVTAWATAIFADAGEWDWREAASRVEAPVFLVHGRQDMVAPPEGAETWAAAFPDALIYWLEDGGHAPWFDVPERVFPPVMTFLRSMPATD